MKQWLLSILFFSLGALNSAHANCYGDDPFFNNALPGYWKINVQLVRYLVHNGEIVPGAWIFLNGQNPQWDGGRSRSANIRDAINTAIFSGGEGCNKVRALGTSTAAWTNYGYYSLPLFPEYKYSYYLIGYTETCSAPGRCNTK